MMSAFRRFAFAPLKPPPAHHGGQAVRSPEFAAETAASTVWCFEPLLAFLQPGKISQEK